HRVLRHIRAGHWLRSRWRRRSAHTRRGNAVDSRPRAALRSLTLDAHPIFQRPTDRPRPAPLDPRRHGVLRAGRRGRNILLGLRVVPARERAADRAARNAAAVARLARAIAFGLARPLHGTAAARARRRGPAGGAVAADTGRAAALPRARGRGAARLARAVSQRCEPRRAAVDEHHARPRLGTAPRALLWPSHAPD